MFRKKRLAGVICAGLMTAALTACGGKEPVTDQNGNIITEDALNEAEASVYEESVSGESSSSPDAISESVSNNTETISNNVSESSGTISDNAETVSESSETISDNAETVSESSEMVSDNGELYTAAENSKMLIANLSGSNLTKLMVTFNAGNLQNQDILNGEKFKDGSSCSYTIDDMDSLKNAKNLTLSVKGEDKKGTELDFGSITVVDPTGIILILEQTDDGYRMYLK